ncbi:ORF6N domain-containing protein [Candidatus Parcubacteria bacterium]|nr:ORF6N domain-containing protein [Candidatus Parcubacteria bacterium]
MEKKREISAIEPAHIGQHIFIVRGQKVIIDSDLAQLYQVSTKQLNQQIKRNRERFPSDFMFQLSLEEAESLDRSQIVTGSGKHRNPRFRPYVFTEHGVAMLSSVLKSERAVQMSIFIVRAFIKLREMLATHKDLARKIEDLERAQREQGDQLAAVYSIVKQLIDYPAKEPKPIGFQTKP